jgi:hypothetical protein
MLLDQVLQRLGLRTLSSDPNAGVSMVTRRAECLRACTPPSTPATPGCRRAGGSRPRVTGGRFNIGPRSRVESSACRRGGHDDKARSVFRGPEIERRPGQGRPHPAELRCDSLLMSCCCARSSIGPWSSRVFPFTSLHPSLSQQDQIIHTPGASVRFEAGFLTGVSSSPGNRRAGASNDRQKMTPGRSRAGTGRALVSALPLRWGRFLGEPP